MRCVKLRYKFMLTLTLTFPILRKSEARDERTDRLGATLNAASPREGHIITSLAVTVD